MKKMQAGFTLIELMIVVAIVGILAAIALPAYQDYIIRSKVSELALAADSCKTSVLDFAQTNGSYPGDATSAGCSDAAGQYAAAPTVNAGVVTVAATSALSGVTGNLVLTPTPTTFSVGSVVTWKCTGSIPAKYLPANCR